MNRLEQAVQHLLWSARWVMLLPVAGLLAGAIYFAVQTDSRSGGPWVQGAWTKPYP